MSNAPKKSLPRPERKTESAKTEASTHSTSRHIALLAARAGLEKKATNIEIIDVMGKVDYADYLVLMTGASDRNVAAIAQEVDGVLAKAGFRSMSVEGLPAAQWVLVDFVDVVVHVFQKDVRSLYDLDGLWMDAERVPLEPATAEPAADVEEAAPAVKRTVKVASKKRPTKKAKTATRKTTGSTGAKKASKGTASRGAASRGTASKGTASRGAASKGTATRGTASKTAATKPSAAKPAAPKSATRKATASKATRRAKTSRSK
jgi:ribosome-associated protein